MFTAFTIDNLKIEPIYNAICFCGNCGHRVYPKCVTPGKEYLINKHFAHPKGIICDDWYEPVSEWHHNWQSYVPIEQREVSIEHGTVRHIADIYLDVPNVVVELQKSHIPFDIKKKRDSFYNRIIWLIHKNLSSASWVTTSTKPVFIDMLDGSIKTPHGNTISKDQFIKDILNNSNLKYEDWSFGFDGKTINTKFGKKTISDIIEDDHLVFLHDTTFTSQCLLCNNTTHQHQELNELIDIKGVPHFQCSFCGNIYAAYLVKNDPRGDDDDRLVKQTFKQNDPFFGKSLQRIREKTKQNKINGKTDSIIIKGILENHNISIKNQTLICECKEKNEKLVCYCGGI